MFHRCAHCMKLVVARHFLDQTAIVFKQHEEAQIVQQIGRCQCAAHQSFKLLKLAQWVQRDAIYRAPLHEALRIG